MILGRVRDFRGLRIVVDLQGNRRDRTAVHGPEEMLRFPANKMYV